MHNIIILCIDSPHQTEKAYASDRKDKCLVSTLPGTMFFKYINITNQWISHSSRARYSRLDSHWLETYTVTDLRWWLLCREIHSPTSRWKAHGVHYLDGLLQLKLPACA